MPTTPKQYRRPGWQPPVEKRPHWHKWYCLKAWRTRRANYLDKHPLCASCEQQGLAVLAVDVDHVDDHKGDWMAFIAGRLQGLCKECHGRKTYHDTTAGGTQVEHMSEHDEITMGGGQI